MADFDPDDCLSRYRLLIARRPDLFENPPGLSYEILQQPEDIARAQEAARLYRLEHGLPADDTRIGVIAEDPYIMALRDAVRFPDGSLGIYNRLVIPSGVITLPIFDGQVVLNYRFRHGPRRFVYEAPRGMLPQGWTFEDAAREELEEEIGATGISLYAVGDYHSNTGVACETMKLFVAKIDGIGSPSKHEAIERIEVTSIAKVEAMIRDGTITDAATLAVYARAKLNNYL
jgi:ADP-ribose pyrophosphatase